MNKKRIAAATIGVVALAVALPVVFTSLTASENRELIGVNLADTTYQEIRFRNQEQDIELAGMLFKPESSGLYPAAVVIHGSGTSRRDNRWYLSLVDHLQQHGIAVLLPDKRGSENSEGNWRSASFADLATDTKAAIQYFKNDSGLEISSIGVIGMSQGGHIAPLVAQQSADIAYVVNVVGGALPMHHSLIYEENHNLRQMGFLPGVSNAIALISTRYLIHVRQQKFWDSIGNFDPLPHWQQLSVPAFVLYGQDDTNVDSTNSASRLNSLNKSNINVTIFPGSGHALESPVGQGNRIIRQDALDRISKFIHLHASSDRQP